MKMHWREPIWIYKVYVQPVSWITDSETKYTGVGTCTYAYASAVYKYNEDATTWIDRNVQGVCT